MTSLEHESNDTSASDYGNDMASDYGNDNWDVAGEMDVCIYFIKGYNIVIECILLHNNR